VERIEQDGHHVVALSPETTSERLGRENPVALHEAGDDPVRVTVTGEHADIQRGAVEHHPHLGGFGRGGADLRLVLPESGNDPGALPGGLVEAPVEPYAGLVRPDAVDQDLGWVVPA
jgi:hypothetical protein